MKSFIKAQYIPKDAILEEINQRIEDYKSHKIDDSYHDGLIFALEDLRDDFINTIEVKEVDLEKEIKNEIDEYWYDNDYGAIQRHGGTITMEVSDVKDIAKHFFELGMTSSNKAQKGE